MVCKIELYPFFFKLRSHIKTTRATTSAAIVSMRSRYFLLLCLILALRAMIIVSIILHAGIGIGPEEAQYWTWSQNLDWGYYSKPPGIAWMIWLSTQWLGNTELRVRAGSLMVGSLIPLLVYFMAQCCRLIPIACFWTGIMIAFSPMGILSTLLAVTDVGMETFRNNPKGSRL